jgi:hypothetical protein
LFAPNPPFAEHINNPSSRAHKRVLSGASINRRITGIGSRPVYFPRICPVYRYAFCGMRSTFGLRDFHRSPASGCAVDGKLDDFRRRSRVAKAPLLVRNFSELRPGPDRRRFDPERPTHSHSVVVYQFKSTSYHRRVCHGNVPDWQISNSVAAHAYDLDIPFHYVNALTNWAKLGM